MGHLWGIDSLGRRIWWEPVQEGVTDSTYCLTIWSNWHTCRLTEEVAQWSTVWAAWLNLSLVALVDSFQVHVINNSNWGSAGGSRAEHEFWHQEPAGDHLSFCWAFSFWNQLPYMPLTWTRCLQNTDWVLGARRRHMLRCYNHAIASWTLVYAHLTFPRKLSLALLSHFLKQF